MKFIEQLYPLGRSPFLYAAEIPFMCSFFVAWNLQPETIFVTKILVGFHCDSKEMCLNHLKNELHLCSCILQLSCREKRNWAGPITPG
jgi:hypothetical protein